MILCLISHLQKKKIKNFKNKQFSNMVCYIEVSICAANYHAVYTII